MRAAMIVEYQQPLEIVNVADPVLPKDGIIMKVRATGVCRSDWHTWMGHYSDHISLPLIPGHEMAGDVLEVGAEVTGLAPGDRVTVPFGLACGRCHTCLDGNHQSCTTQVQPSTDFDGSFAEFIACHGPTSMSSDSPMRLAMPRRPALAAASSPPSGVWSNRQRYGRETGLRCMAAAVSGCLP